MAKQHKPAETEREWWALLKSKDHTVIRSMKDWRAALADPERNPLKGCDSKSVANFTKNLKFRNGGLAHANYGEVASQLNYAQFALLWAGFGLGMGIFNDHDGFECSGKGNCKEAQHNICTSNC